MVRQTASVIVLELLGGLLLLVVVGSAILAGRLASGPLQIDLLRGELADALTSARDGRVTTIEGVSLEWERSERRMKVVAQGVALSDGKGEVAGTAARAFIDLDSSALLRGEVKVLRVRLLDGRLDVRQIGPSHWSVAGDPLPPIPAGTLPQTPQEWIEAANRILPVVLDALETQSGQLDLDLIRFDGIEVRFLSLDNTQLMTLAGASGAVERAPDALSLFLAGQGVGRGLPQGIAVDIAATEGYQRLHAELALAGWSLSALAERLGADQLETYALPADTAFAFDVSKQDGLERIGLVAEAGRGSIRLFDRQIDIDGVALDASYDALSDILSVRADDLVSDLARGSLQVSMAQAARTDETGRRIELGSDRLVINASPMFENPLSVSDVAITADVNVVDRTVDLVSASLGIEEARLRASGAFRLIDANEAAGTIPLRGDLAAELIGPVDAKTVIAFWPVRLGADARNFASTRILGGTATEATAKLVLDDDSFEEGGLSKEALQVRFTLEDVELVISSDLPNIKNGRGIGLLTGNSFSVEVAEAGFSEWTVSEGLVEFARFRPKGEPMRVLAKGQGPVLDILQVLSESKLQLEARTGFDPARASGRATATFELFRPTRPDVPFEDLVFTVDGRIRDGGLTGAASGLDLTGARASVKMDEKSLTIAGYGELGPAPIQFTWRDALADDDMPAMISASAVVNPDVLNRFGLLGRTFLSGEIPVEVQASAAGSNIESADIAFDLTSARIDFAEIGWIKPAGDPARATVTFDAKDKTNAASARLEAGSALFDGEIRFQDNGQLLSADLRRAFLDDRADVSGQIVRNGDGGLSVSLTGPFLDISSAMPSVSAVGDGDGFDNAITLDAEVGRLRLREDLEMLDARMAMISSKAGLQSFTAAGKTVSGEPFEAQFRARESGDTIRVTSGDAEFLMRAFLGTDFLEGGALAIDGTLADGATPTRLNIKVTNARLRNAPFLTQILSLASLRGLADTLGGEGVLFSEIEVPLTIAGGRYVVDGGRASGPALGLTVNGFLGAEDGAIGLDGVLVPSFGLNSALGGIPIIGDLVVGRDGEGVFSLTYSVRGSLDKAQVSVNPLSAVAPGIIRRIFENPAQTDVPEFEPRAPDDPVPSELEPLPPPEEL